MLGHFYIVATLLLTVYGQLVLRWRMAVTGELPASGFEKLRVIASCFTDPWVLSSFFAGFLGSLTWMAAMTKYELSYAYPFMSLAFALTLIFGWLFLGETLTPAKFTGVGLIAVGVYVGSR